MSPTDPHQPPLDYVPHTRPRRTVATWILLLGVWAVGLVFWTIYLFLILYLFFAVFGG